MNSRVSRFCDGIMEAAWLAAVILAPVFFNVYSSRIFEPDKIALLRTLALIIAAAWVVKIVDTGWGAWGQLKQSGSPVRNFLKTPLVAPALALVLIYLLSTLFSVTPAVSWSGSYQRLQGAYTTLSYLVIFGAIIANLRRRSQVDRLITTVIVASLPVALYGVLQRYRLDTIPWGGDTHTRIAANLGNSIFVAAYLIMVFPLTLARIVENFREILRSTQRPVAPMILASVYIFIATLQVIAIYLSGSRGPALGLLASVFFFLLLLTLFWRKRWLTFGMLGAAALAVLFLLIFNLPAGPLEALRASPAVGRFGSLLNSESSSALVRRYIWEGVVDLVSPHAPLELPDGSSDRFNLLRPLIGYGPESMYVAYNQFYVSDLGKVERRNASPDRSHNETWDSVVITGMLGFSVYFCTVGLVFYYGFKWLGLIPDRKYRSIFIALFVAGSLAGALFFGLWRGVEYLGVGLPFGALLGLLVYVVWVALSGRVESPTTDGQAVRYFTLLGLVAGILAYFVESNFGISIAVTKTNFWVFSGLLVVVGYFLPRLAENQAANRPDVGLRAGRPGHSPAASKRESSDKNRQQPTSPRSNSNDQRTPNWVGQGLLAGWVGAILLVTLGYDYLSNTDSVSRASQVIALLGSDRYFGIVFLLVTTWLLAGLLLTLSEGHASRGAPAAKHSLYRLLLALGTSAVLALIYYYWHASALAAFARVQVNSIDEMLGLVKQYEQLLAQFYIYLLLLLFGLALTIAIWVESSHSEDATRPAQIPLTNTWLSIPLLVILLAAAIYAASVSNLRVIQADIAFKLADSFARPGYWQAATAIYEHAIDRAPTEDFYYLFLGRADLEHSRTIQDDQSRDSYIFDAKNSLLKAQGINPLNTDHTANLARLYSTWATLTSDPALREERSAKAAEYYADAVRLSPNNPRLWSEWALHDYSMHSDIARADKLLQAALAIDPEYDWAYGLSADIGLSRARAEQDPERKRVLLEETIANYQKAIQFINPYEPQNRFSYWLALGNAHALLGQGSQALSAFSQALGSAPSADQRWQVEELIGEQYYAMRDSANALAHLQAALALAPSEQQQRLQTLIDQIQNTP